MAVEIEVTFLFDLNLQSHKCIFHSGQRSGDSNAIYMAKINGTHRKVQRGLSSTKESVLPCKINKEQSTFIWFAIQVYESLRDHGHIAEDPVIEEESVLAIPAPPPKLAPFEDEEKARLLKELLQVCTRSSYENRGQECFITLRIVKTSQSLESLDI